MLVNEILRATRHFIPQLVVANAIAVTYVLILAAGPTLGKVEGWLFPVTEQTVITKTETFENGTKFWGESKKLRSCPWVDQKWFLQTEDGRVDARLKIIESPRIRKPGDFSFGPWVVEISPQDLILNSYSVVQHQCHWLFDTYTEFYPRSSR